MLHWTLSFQSNRQSVDPLSNHPRPPLFSFPGTEQSRVATSLAPFCLNDSCIPVPLSCNRPSLSFWSTLLEPRVLKLQRSAVLRYSPDHVVWRAGGDLSLDLERDGHLGIQQPGEVLDHLRWRGRLWGRPFCWSSSELLLTLSGGLFSAHDDSSLWFADKASEK
jgi:hypothetical protein